MATPNVDRLHGIEPWDPRINETTNEEILKIRDDLNLVADLTGRAAADLGMRGSTAQAAQAQLTSLTRKVHGYADGLTQLVDVRTTVITSGRNAQNTSHELQKELAEANRVYRVLEAVADSSPVGEAVLAQARSKRDAAHAKLEAKASETLESSRQVTVDAIANLPFKPKDVPGVAGRDDGKSLARHAPAGAPVAAGASERVPGSGAAGGSSVGLPRSATEWRASGTGEGSLGYAGPVPPEPGSVGLQASHYTPEQTGVIAGSGRRSVLDSPAVYNPLAAAAMTGGAAVAGYRAYQAVRAARAARSLPVSMRAASQSGAAVRTPAPTGGKGILRGATTAVRAPAAGATAPARGGASGIARPVSASSQGRSSGILRGTTTAPRARVPAPGSSRGSGIVKGATTVARARTTDPARMGITGKQPSPNARSGSAAGTSRAGAGARESASSKTAASKGASKTQSSRGRPAAAGTLRNGAQGESQTGQTRQTDSRGHMRKPGTSRASAASRAFSLLTGRAKPGKTDTDEKTRQPPHEETRPSPYEPDRRTTFLPAGHRDTTDT
mgnify:CR=1 FL=1